jgi:two-component system, NarL family, response regulator NreC
MAKHLRLAPASSPAGSNPRASSPIRVVLADDHAMMRRSLRQLFDGEDDVRVIAEAGDQEAAVRYVHDHRPCVLVIDLRLPGGSSLETVAWLRESAPSTQIVVMTMEASPAFARRAFALGAAGFVAKDLADDELLEAVRVAACGGRYAGPRVAHALPRPLLAAAPL